MKHEEGSLRGLLVAGAVRGLSKLGGGRSICLRVSRCGLFESAIVVGLHQGGKALMME